MESIDPTPVFFKVRGAVFVSTMILSLVWTSLLCAEASMRYDVTEATERTLILILIFVNAITAILLPALLIVEFRVWLDGARLFFLLIAHIGGAGVFTAWYTTYTCPDQTPNKESVCALINISILLCSWAIPVILTAYAGFLGSMYQLHFRYADGEKRRSALPMMLPPQDGEQKHTSATLSFMAQAGGMSHPSWQPSKGKDIENDGEHRHSTANSLGREDPPRSQSPARLTKRLPQWFFS